MIYLDFQKAFDTVPHHRLLTKLKSYGIQGKLLGWINSFLTGREQRVVLNGTSSERAHVSSGIQQGSVLGPILFTICINDLPDILHNTSKLFADDTKIYSTVYTQEDQKSLQEDLYRLENWSNLWLLKFNKDKCKHLHLGKIVDSTYRLFGQEIQKVTDEKDLGIYIDSQLNFKLHIDFKIKQIRC